MISADLVGPLLHNQTIHHTISAEFFYGHYNYIGMKLFVVLKWDWENESKLDSDFTILGIFADENKAKMLLDEVQHNALITETLGCFYWIEEHTLNETKEGITP